MGFDMVALGQHFLSTEFQMLQPAIVAARLAAETGPMRLGITIYLLPLLNPVAVAEEAASLDVITGGRFILGAGLGYRAVEDEAFGLGQGERVPRLRQHLEVVKRLWAGDTVTFDSPTAVWWMPASNSVPSSSPIRPSGLPPTTTVRWNAPLSWAMPG